MAYQDLLAARQNLQQQVQSGGIQQYQMDAELNRLKQQNLQESKNQLQQQVSSGGITQQQADQEFSRLQSLPFEQYAQAASPATQPPPQQGVQPPPQATVAPGTGVHKGPGGVPVAPVGDLSTPAGALSLEEQFARWNIEQQKMVNRPDTEGVFGSQRYETDPRTGRTTIRQELDPTVQQQLGQEQQIGLGAGGQIQGQIGAFGQQGPFGYEGNVAPGLSQQDLLGERQRVEQSVMDTFERQNAPRFEQERKALEQSLADRGIPPTSARGQQEMQQMSQRQENARLNAQSQATQLGRKEFETSFGASEQVRGRETGEYEKQFYSPLTTAGQLQGFQAPLRLPQFQQMSDIQVPQFSPSGIGLGYGQQELGYAGLQSAEDIARMQEEGATGRKALGVEAEMQTAADRLAQQAEQAGTAGDPSVPIENPYGQNLGQSKIGQKSAQAGLTPEQEAKWLANMTPEQRASHEDFQRQVEQINQTGSPVAQPGYKNQGGQMSSPPGYPTPFGFNQQQMNELQQAPQMQMRGSPGEAPRTAQGGPRHQYQQRPQPPQQFSAKGGFY